MKTKRLITRMKKFAKELENDCLKRKQKCWIETNIRSKIKESYCIVKDKAKLKENLS